MKLDDTLVIYRDRKFYSAFPSVVCRPDGELLVAFRRAPDRRLLGQSAGHCDPNSQLVLVRSADGGATWSGQPELISAHAMGGSQDPCLLQCSDGTLLCSSYLWVLVPGFKPVPADAPAGRSPGWCYRFGGGYLMRSVDNGRHWTGPLLPPTLPGEERTTPWGDPLPACNRGPILEGSDGLLYWAVVGHRGADRPHAVHLLASADRGLTWEYRCPVAADDRVTFNETALVESADGDLLAFMRTGGLDDHTVMARSRDRGRSFEPWTDAGFQGHPHHATRLPDGRIVLAYGYRHTPHGIRARLLKPDASDLATAPETVLRADGGNHDLGYPWTALLPDGRVLVVYYFNRGAESTRSIEGTLLEIP